MFRVIAVIYAFSIVTECVIVREEINIVYERLRRLKRQSTPGVIKFGENQNANINPLAGIVPDTNIGRSQGGQVNVAQPSASFGRNLDILGLYNQQRGVQDAGIRDGNNVGASWGNQNSLLGGVLGWGNKNDVNFNGNNGELSVQKQKGIPGLAMETTDTRVNPAALQFGRQQRKCYMGILTGDDGICFDSNNGVRRSG